MIRGAVWQYGFDIAEFNVGVLNLQLCLMARVKSGIRIQYLCVHFIVPWCWFASHGLVSCALAPGRL